MAPGPPLYQEGDGGHLSLDRVPFSAPGPTLTAYCGVWLTSIAAGPGALLIRVLLSPTRNTVT